ncbi:hypothetical protein LTR36_001430 [Oleoguttula mirabilis]|uniref:Uncharacterized protein n=1 Tax=Oleoguttula mirabilis TaxID=1507867 RepID=A0AAV9JPC7_9PEZI|nr:hypothetical protein LTR36_001430 [Oleoguttula mirabilis]
MSKKGLVRDASHAGSWYTASKAQLSSQLDGWLAAVKIPVQCIGPLSEGQTVTELPTPGARVIIAPHAGYSYSGPAAAYAYKAWDVSKAKRIFLLGPSHHHYLTKAALTRCTHYATPLGNLAIDRETTTLLHKTGHFDLMSQSVDEDEHSLEMHLPYIYKILSKTFGDNPAAFPPLIPILVGNTSVTTEMTLGLLLAGHLADPTTAFVISSDFAHWGTRFRYTHYQPSDGQPAQQLPASLSTAPSKPAIHESIKQVDFECMGACESGSHVAWLEELESNSNTVCGRHPIGVVMAAIEEVRTQEGTPDIGAFKFVRYERSGEVKRVSESSVSYASAFAVM